jgi:acetyl-CoA synthetase
MLKTVRSYEEACRTFRWRIPERYNLAFDVCDRQTMAGADGHRTALITEAADGTVERYTFHVLRLLSNRLANVLAGFGVAPGDRVVMALGQGVEAAAAVLAVLKMGAVAVPVPSGFGLEPLSWRLADSGAKVALVETTLLPTVNAARERLPELVAVLSAEEMWQAMELAPDSFPPLVTAAEDAAFLFYPPDACGRPKGALHAHRAMLGCLPAVELALGFFPQFGDIMWTSAEWATGEALLWAVLPAWHHGVPVVARAGAFHAETALDLLGRHGVRTAYLPPQDLDRLTVVAASRAHAMPRALMSGPEPLDTGLHGRVARVFGINAHEAWGTLESGAVACNQTALIELRPGSPGRAAPGVTVETMDQRGRTRPAGNRGILAVAPEAPGVFLGYWGGADPDCPAKFVDGWLLTGRPGYRDLDGWLWPERPVPDVGIVLVDGLRVAVAEVEAALCLHPDVAAAAVALLPGGELKAFVVPKGRPGDVALARELQIFAATRRAAHEVPRRVEFVVELPRGADGGIARDGLAAMPIRLDAPSADDRLR